MSEIFVEWPEPIQPDSSTLFLQTDVIGVNPRDLFIPAGIAGPRRRRSIVTRGGTLGCGDYRVAIEPRGGGLEVMRLRHTQVQYTRLWCATGQITVNVEGIAECAPVCDDLRKLAAWQYEFVIYRNNVEVARGPLIRPEVTASSGTLGGDGMSAWLRRRALRGDLTPGTPLDPVDLGISVMASAQSYAIAGHAYGASPGLSADARTRVGVAVIPELPARQKASEAFGKLVEQGLVWTDGPGHSIILGGPDLFGTEPIATLRDSDFVTPPTITGAGDEQVNGWIVESEDQEADQEPFIGYAYDEDSIIRNGLLEDVARVPGLTTQDAANRAAAARLIASKEMPRHVTGGTLSQDAPVDINKLYPGTILRVVLEGCLPEEQIVRLSGLDATANAGGETVKVSFSEADVGIE